MFELSTLLMLGLELPKNEVAAINLLQSAAVLGMPAAMNNLGVSYALGTGVEKNKEMALSWLHKAANAGFPLALANAKAVEEDDWPKAAGDVDVATFCKSDLIHNGNVLTQLNMSGVHRANTKGPAGIRVTAIGVEQPNHAFSQKAAVIKGKSGTLFMFTNGHFVYKIDKEGANDEKVFYQTEASNGITNTNILVIKPTDWHTNKTWIIVHKKPEVGTASSDIIVAYEHGADNDIYGMGGDDALFGWDGTDMLHGGEGNDVLFGEYGPDKLWGGPGADIFVADATDLKGGDKGKFFNTIYDFNPAEGDVIYLGYLVDEPELARKDVTNHLRMTPTGTGIMVQINNQHGEGWQNAIFIEGQQCSCQVQKLVADGNIVF